MLFMPSSNSVFSSSWILNHLQVSHTSPHKCQLFFILSASIQHSSSPDRGIFHFLIIYSGTKKLEALQFRLTFSSSLHNCQVSFWLVTISLHLFLKSLSRCTPLSRTLSLLMSPLHLNFASSCPMQSGARQSWVSENRRSENFRFPELVPGKQLMKGPTDSALECAF